MSNRSDICEAVAAFMKGPRTRVELEEMIGLGRNASTRILRYMRDSGIIYIAERREHPLREDGNRKLGSRIPVCALQPTPFANEDAPVRGSRRKVHRTEAG